MALGLRFEVTAEGFINFKTIKYFKSRVIVENTFSHENLSPREHLFPELFKLDALITSSKLVDSNYILECDLKS